MTAPHPAVDPLFTELKFRNLTLKNRVLRSSMTGRFDHYDGSGSSVRVRWEERFARGGVGAIVSAHAPVHVRGRISPNVAMIDDDRRIPFWSRVVEAVHAHDCRYIIQLSFSGRQRDVPGVENRYLPGWSAVSGRDPVHGLPSEAMTQADIASCVDSFRQAARRAREAGADGIEIHACNGYLFTQFLDPDTNRRTDSYGGSLENRARLLLEVVEAIRAEVGPGYHLQVKLNGRDDSDSLLPWRGRGNSGDDYVTVARWLEARAVDAIVVSCGAFAPHPRNPAGDLPLDAARGTYDVLLSSGGLRAFVNYVGLWTRPLGPLIRWWWGRARGRRLDAIEGILVEDARPFKQALGIPVLVTGGFQTASRIRQLVAENAVDGVTIARPLIANPDLVHQFAAGRDRPERPCTYCNRCLIEALENPLGCYEPRRFDGDVQRMIAEVMAVYAGDEDASTERSAG